MALFVESSVRSSGKVVIGCKRWCMMAILSIILVTLMLTSVLSRSAPEKFKHSSDLDLKLVHVVMYLCYKMTRFRLKRLFFDNRFSVTELEHQLTLIRTILTSTLTLPPMGGDN